VPVETCGRALEFRRCDPWRPPASELIDAVLDEYDAIAGRALSGGPSATRADFSPPGGAFVVGFLDIRPWVIARARTTTTNPPADVWGEKRL
jgi:hypothetical protein